MDIVIEHPKYACQVCGSTRKVVETVVGDEFIWNESEKCQEPSKFSDEFERANEERLCS